MPKIIGGSLTEHRTRTRIKLFAALGTLMLERGFDAITLADIAATAGVGRTAVYNHFPDKEALLLAYMKHETEEYIASLEEALEGVDDPVEQMRTYVRRQAQLKRVYRLSPGPDLRSVVSPATQMRLREHAMLLSQVLRRILESGMDAGVFARQPIDQTATLVNACLSTRPPQGDDAARAAAVRATEDFVLRALGAEQVPAAHAPTPVGVPVA